MPDLKLHGRPVTSVFQLLGQHENDICYSVAWGLAACPAFLEQLLRKILGIAVRAEQVELRLQTHETEGGITDLEIESPGEFYVIIEAKRGWRLPTLRQLQLYCSRSSFAACRAPLKRIVPLSECSREYALGALGVRSVGGTPISPLSWKDVGECAVRARARGTHAQKRLLDELATYLGGIMTMQQTDSNWVYVVALNSGMESGWGISWIDIVRKKRRYFHPVGTNGWPKEPPNHMAFRYHGKLQSIHHVERFEVITDLHSGIGEIPSKRTIPHFLYTLGPAFGPAHEVPTGRIYPNGRVWCMLDTLFTSKTIGEARDISKKRQQQ